MSILVTGASRGIGRQVAINLAKSGHSVVVLARNRDALEELRCELPTDQGQIHGVAAFDLLDCHDFKLDQPITGLVHSAGIAPAQLLLRTSPKDIERCFQVNTVAPMILTKQLLRGMMRSGQGGSFIYLSSILAQRGWPGMATYSASKAALEAFSRSMAREMGPKGYTFNCVAPALVDTDMGRASDIKGLTSGCIVPEMLTPQDVAKAVEYVLGNRAVNGQTINVDNGFLA